MKKKNYMGWFVIRRGRRDFQIVYCSKELASKLGSIQFESRSWSKAENIRLHLSSKGRITI